MSRRIKAGDVFSTREGGSVVVIEYRRWSEVLVKHQDERGHEAIVQADRLFSGRIKNPYRPVTCGVGYVGVGPHKTRIGRKNTPPYNSWLGMLRRCYDPKMHEKYPTYVGCSVNPIWHNFQNFAAWWSVQPNRETDGFSLDKDLIVLGNKEYGPETCSFVPQDINILLTDSGAARGAYPIGVMWHKRDRKFYAALKVDGARKFLGYFATAEEASSAYRVAKADRIEVMADRHRDAIDHRVYRTLMRDADELRRPLVIGRAS